MATKTSAVTVSGVLVRCVLRREAEVDFNYSHRYAPNSEHYVLFLDCELRTDAGETVYFTSPRTRMTVANCPGASVVIFGDSIWDDSSGSHVFPADHPWLREQVGKAVATPGSPNGNALLPKLAAGDRLAVRGRVKADRVSRLGKPYRVLNYVKRVV